MLFQKKKEHLLVFRTYSMSPHLLLLRLVYPGSLLPSLFAKKLSIKKQKPWPVLCLQQKPWKLYLPNLLLACSFFSEDPISPNPEVFSTKYLKPLISME